MAVEAQPIQKSRNQHQHPLPPLLPDKSTEPDSICGEEMNVECGDEVTTAKYLQSVLQKGSNMGAADQTDRKPGKSEKKWTGPPTTVGSNNRDKLSVTDTSPVPPFEHLTRGDLHTSCGKFWAFTGVQFPGSRDTLTTLIPTLHLPISGENLA